MGIKDSLRPMLPPTSRAFINKSDELVGRLEDISRQVTERQAAADTRYEEIKSDLDGMKVEMAELKAYVASIYNDVSFLAKRLRYANPEYASLSTASTDAPRILIAGWYGAENFGDELMLQAVIAAMPQEALSRVSVLLWDNNPYPDGFIDDRITPVHYPVTTWDLEELANTFDALVWGGGAIIDDKQYTESRENYNTGNLFIRLSRRMLNKGKKVYCLGLSSNNVISNPGYASALSDIIARSSLFSLRDPESLITLQKAGCDCSNIVLCEDLAFAHPDMQSALDISSNRSKHGLPDTKHIALVFLTIDSMFDHYVTVLRELCSIQFEDGTKPDITLVPFHNEGLIDTKYCRRLKESLDTSAPVKIASYARTISDLDLGRFDAVISYKYHSALISLVTGVPTLCVYDQGHPHYKNKMMHLSKLFGTESSCIPANVFENKVSQSIKDLSTNKAGTALPKDFLDMQRSWLRHACVEIAQKNGDDF